jgi:type I restriction enzyme S subunit
MSRKSYPKYKPSGIEWLGEIPEHWDIEKLKYLSSVQFSNVDKHTIEDEEQVHLCNYTDVYYNDFITPDLQLMKATATPSEITKFGLCDGDVLITKDSESCDDIAVPAFVLGQHDRVLCGYHLAQIRPNPNRIFGKYLFRSFCAHNINDQFRIAATGITRYGLGKYWIDNGLFPVPSLDEQRAIASFLDRETGKIDSLIEKKERQIGLLQEKRAALISHVVTKGLDPTVPMKPSGIEWLGEIPEHWELTRLGWITTDINDINHEMPESAQEGILFLSAKDLLNDGTLNFKKDVKLISEEDFKRLSQKILPKRDDIIYSRIGACLGKARLVETDERFLISYSCCVVRLDKRYARPRFFRHLLDAEMVLTEAKVRTQGIGVPDLGLREICRFPVPLPTMDEQEAISDFLDERIGNLRRLITTVEMSIDKLREYRTALISAAVTGKIDVREDQS